MSIVSGFKLEFVSKPIQRCIPHQIRFSKDENIAIGVELDRLLDIGAVIHSQHEKGEFISNIFVRSKSSGKIRVILNLKELNRFVCYHHFKMEHLPFVLELVHMNDQFGSIDLSDAYFSVPVAQDHWKYFKFMWNGVLYAYKVMMFGLSPAPRIFTKICKPILASLRASHAIRCSLYIDDMIVMAHSASDLTKNLDLVCNLFQDLGFVINYEKSMLTPSCVVKHLGFIIDSNSMSISIPDEKHLEIRGKCRMFSVPDSISIRQGASLIGTLQAYGQGTEWGRLFYRDMERDKIKALRRNVGNFEAKYCLSEGTRQNLKFWMTTGKPSPRFFGHRSYHTEIFSDASLTGWGAHLGGTKAGGNWSREESTYHINWLELKACWLALKSFASNSRNINIAVRLDNTCAMHYVNNMGGVIESLDHLAKEIWLWCRERNLFITASYIPGSENVIADFASRNINVNTEWSLNGDIFHDINAHFGPLKCDLFASRLNHKLNKYVSWRPDPNSVFVDAFSQSWNTLGLCYAFPPFNLIGKVLNKVFNERLELVIVLPNWPTQHWFPSVLECLVDEPILLPCKPDTVCLEHDKESLHPIWKKLNLICCRLSGKR